MLNDFQTCPICNGNLEKSVIDNTFYCETKHFYFHPNKWANLYYHTHRVFFYHNSTDIGVYDNGNIHSAILNHDILFKDLDTLEKCIEIIRNYRLLT